MKRSGRITAAFGVIVLAAIFVVGAFSVSATGGDQTDPLITLSYLTNVVTPELMDKVDEKVQANEQVLAEKLDTAIGAYSDEMEQALSEGVGESASFAVVSLSSGQAIFLQAGGEVLLRAGVASVAAGNSPVLMDTTSGNILEVGGSLKGNHLYVAPLEGAILKVSSDSLLMVRGAYTLA